MSICFDFSVRDARKLLCGLVFFELFLVMVFAVDSLLGSPSLNFKWFVNLDEEGNLPAWFSAIQLFMIGSVFLLKSRHRRAGHAPAARFFLVVGVGFIFLSADEAAKGHEMIHFVLGKIFKGDGPYWIYFYVVIAAILFLIFHRSIIAMWNRYRHESILMATGFGLIVLGAAVLERMSFAFLRSGSTPVGYGIEVAIEEFLEMFGASVILYGAMLLLLHDSRVAICPDHGDSQDASIPD